MPNQKLTVPFKIKDNSGKELFLQYKVGFIGCNINDKNEVYPVTGWIVSPYNKGEDDEVKESDETYIRSKHYDNDEDDEDDDDDDWDWFLLKILILKYNEKFIIKKSYN